MPISVYYFLYLSGMFLAHVLRPNSSHRCSNFTSHCRSFTSLQQKRLRRHAHAFYFPARFQVQLTYFHIHVTFSFRSPPWASSKDADIKYAYRHTSLVLSFFVLNLFWALIVFKMVLATDTVTTLWQRAGQYCAWHPSSLGTLFISRRLLKRSKPQSCWSRGCGMEPGTSKPFSSYCQSRVSTATSWSYAQGA